MPSHPPLTRISVNLRWDDEDPSATHYNIGTIYFYVSNPSTLPIRLFTPECIKRARHLFPALREFEKRTAVSVLRDNVSGKTLGRLETLKDAIPAATSTSTAATASGGKRRKERRRKRSEESRISLTLLLKVIDLNRLSERKRKNREAVEIDRRPVTFIRGHPAAALNDEFIEATVSEDEEEEEEEEEELMNKGLKEPGNKKRTPHPAISKMVIRSGDPDIDNFFNNNGRGGDDDFDYNDDDDDDDDGDESDYTEYATDEDDGYGPPPDEATVAEINAEIEAAGGSLIYPSQAWRERQHQEWQRREEEFLARRRERDGQEQPGGVPNNNQVHTADSASASASATLTQERDASPQQPVASENMERHEGQAEQQQVVTAEQHDDSHQPIDVPDAVPESQQEDKNEDEHDTAIITEAQTTTSQQTHHDRKRKLSKSSQELAGEMSDSDARGSSNKKVKTIADEEELQNAEHAAIKDFDHEPEAAATEKEPEGADKTGVADEDSHEDNDSQSRIPDENAEQEEEQQHPEPIEPPPQPSPAGKDDQGHHSDTSSSSSSADSNPFTLIPTRERDLLTASQTEITLMKRYDCTREKYVDLLTRLSEVTSSLVGKIEAGKKEKSIEKTRGKVEKVLGKVRKWQRKELGGECMAEIFGYRGSGGGEGREGENEEVEDEMDVDEKEGEEEEEEAGASQPAVRSQLDKASQEKETDAHTGDVQEEEHVNQSERDDVMKEDQGEKGEENKEQQSESDAEEVTNAESNETGGLKQLPPPPSPTTPEKTKPRLPLKNPPSSSSSSPSPVPAPNFTTATPPSHKAQTLPVSESSHQATEASPIPHPQSPFEKEVHPPSSPVQATPSEPTISYPQLPASNPTSVSESESAVEEDHVDADGAPAEETAAPAAADAATPAAPYSSSPIIKLMSSPGKSHVGTPPARQAPVIPSPAIMVSKAEAEAEAEAEASKSESESESEAEEGRDVEAVVQKPTTTPGYLSRGFATLSSKIMPLFSSPTKPAIRQAETGAEREDIQQRNTQGEERDGGVEGVTMQSDEAQSQEVDSSMKIPASAPKRQARTPESDSDSASETESEEENDRGPTHTSPSKITPETTSQPTQPKKNLNLDNLADSSSSASESGSEAEATLAAGKDKPKSWSQPILGRLSKAPSTNSLLASSTPASSANLRGKQRPLPPPPRTRPARESSSSDSDSDNDDEEEEEEDDAADLLSQSQSRRQSPAKTQPVTARSAASGATKPNRLSLSASQPAMAPGGKQRRNTLKSLLSSQRSLGGW